MDEAKEVDRLFKEGGPYDKNNNRSLYSIMPKEARRVFEEMPISLLTMDESHLEPIVKPTPYMNQLRTAFWQEYDAAQSSDTNMTLKGIQTYMGSSSPSILLREYVGDAKCLAWILIPPVHYDSLVDEALARGLRRIQQIIDLPMMKPDGEIDHKAIELVMKATAFLDMRRNGMPTQKQEIKQLNVNVTRADMRKLGSHTRPEELDRQILELERKLELAHE